MPKSKHRRKNGKAVPHGRGIHKYNFRPIIDPGEQAMIARENAFLASIGRDELTDQEWDELLESQEWLDWKALHPLPNDYEAGL
jgi:hypothetical protein